MRSTPFAKVVAEAGLSDLYPEALAAAERFGAPVFPWHAYLLEGIRGVVADHAGDVTTACKHAKAALEAAAIEDTGLSHDRGHLGTVRNVATPFHQLLLRMADA